MEALAEGVPAAGLPGALGEAGEEQAHDGELFVEGRGPEFPDGDGLPRAPQDVVHVVDLPVLVVQLQVVGEIPGDAGQLNVLAHHLPVRPEAQSLVHRQQLAQILPAPGGGELDALR